MHDNHIYNLMSQMVQEHRSLWRIKNNYMGDAGDCPKCEEFWKKMEADKEDHIKELTALLTDHLK